MDIIPVIDVRRGRTVHARRGTRDDYGPLDTPLASGSDPVAVALGLRSLFAFPVLYVADLDAIEGRGRDVALPKALAAALPGIELWLDSGRSAGEARHLGYREPATTQVLGSESLKREELAALRELAPDRWVLSLDFRDDRFEGPPGLLEDAGGWPERVIVMTLSRVGSGEGPDVARVAEIGARAGRRRVYAAGGVRDRADIAALRAAGAAGILAATALHAGTITAGDLEAIAGR